MSQCNLLKNMALFEKTYATKQINVKSHGFSILKNNVKNAKKEK